MKLVPGRCINVTNQTNSTNCQKFKKNIFLTDILGKQVKCHSSQNPAYPGKLCAQLGFVMQYTIGNPSANE